MTMSDPNNLSILPSAGSPRRRTLLHHQAVTDLGIAIVSGELPEGVPLPIESELGKRLGVSRTVVREATKVLASKGLLRSRPKVGTVPLPRVSWDVLDPEVLGWMLDHGPIADVIRDVSEVRLIIEPAAARLAAMRRSDEEAERLRVLTDDLVGSADDDERYVVTDLDFHAAILSATKNATLVRLTGAIGAALRASRRVTVHAPGGPQSAMAEHRTEHRTLEGHSNRKHEQRSENSEVRSTGLLTSLLLVADAEDLRPEPALLRLFRLRCGGRWRCRRGLGDARGWRCSYGLLLRC